MTPEVYGWRARIGLILPVDNAILEPELSSLRLPGVTFHTFRLTETSPEKMRDEAIALAPSINEFGLDAVVYACAETSFNESGTTESPLSKVMAVRVRRPVITATDALVLAAEQMNASQVAVVTPYSRTSGAVLEEVLKTKELCVVSALHRDFSLETDDRRVWFLTNRIPATEIYEMAKRVDVSAADTLLIISTNLSTFPIIHRLERDLGKTVVTSNQSIVWWCLRTLGLSHDSLLLGRLCDPGVVTAQAPPRTDSASMIRSSL